MTCSMNGGLRAEEVSRRHRGEVPVGGGGLSSGDRDRTVEHLGRSDVGVTMLRRMFKEQMARVSRGEDPLGVIRDQHDRIDLPCEKNKFDAGGSFAIQFIERASSRFSPQADALKTLHTT